MKRHTQFDECSHSPQPRQPVLVLVHADHFVEVFGPLHVDVLFRDVPFIGTAAGEIQSEHYIEASIPLRYRHFYWPDCRRAIHMPRLVTPASLWEAQWNAELLRTIQSIRPMEARARWTL